MGLTCPMYYTLPLRLPLRLDNSLTPTTRPHARALVLKSVPDGKTVLIEAGQQDRAHRSRNEPSSRRGQRISS